MTGENMIKDTLTHIRYDVMVSLFLLLAMLAVYWQVSQHEFINFDDNFHVTGNPYVRSGI